MSEIYTLVTGAAGFIGSAVSSSLHRAGYEVLGVDSFSEYYSVDLKKARVKHFLEKSGIIFKHIDISNYDEINKVVEEFKAELEEQYGAVSIDLKTGEYTKIEDESKLKVAE